MKIGDAVILRKARYMSPPRAAEEAAWEYTDTLGVITDHRRLLATGVEQYRVYTVDGKHGWEVPDDLQLVNKDLTD